MSMFTFEWVLTLICALLCVTNFALGNYVVAGMLLAVLLFDAIAGVVDRS